MNLSDFIARDPLLEILVVVKTELLVLGEAIATRIGSKVGEASRSSVSKLLSSGPSDPKDLAEVGDHFFLLAAHEDAAMGACKRERVSERSEGRR
jgi:hypothetical protein